MFHYINPEKVGVVLSKLPQDFPDPAETLLICLINAGMNLEFDRDKHARRIHILEEKVGKLEREIEVLKKSAKEKS